MAHDQLTLPSVAVTREIRGIEMGVLDDGRSYLTTRGLAKLCGLAPSSMIEQGKNWSEGKRDGKLAQFLIEHGVSGDSLYVEIPGAHAYTDDVAMLILEYYAFESGRNDRAVQGRYRTLARAGLRLFVYHALGYDPAHAVPSPWRQFHDRALLVTAPVGYFSVFQEISGFVLSAIRGGLKVDSHTVPDGSVGKTWSRYWEEEGLESKYGQRTKHPHEFPDYFPQAASNPQEIWVYPVEALPVFRIWMQEEYVPKKLPAYLNRKVKQGLLPPSVAEVLKIEAAAPAPPQLNGDHDSVRP